MKNQFMTKQDYQSPEVKTIELKTQSVVCTSVPVFEEENIDSIFS